MNERQSSAPRRRPDLGKRRGWSVLVLGLACSCGSAPVASVPLTGVVAGKAWNGRGGIASSSRADRDGSKRFDVSDGLGSLSCAYFPRSLAGTIPWVAQSFELSRERSLTFVSRQADGGLESVVVVEGRVELADVTDAGARLRVRARVDAANDVEGEVQLRTCD